MMRLILRARLIKRKVVVGSVTAEAGVIRALISYRGCTGREVSQGARDAAASIHAPDKVVQ